MKYLNANEAKNIVPQTLVLPAKLPAPVVSYGYEERNTDGFYREIIPLVGNWQGYYADGQRQGLWQRLEDFKNPRSLKEEADFVNGGMIEKREFENGHLSARVQYTDDASTYTVEDYFPSGKLRRYRSYNSNHALDSEINYKENGSLKNIAAGHETKSRKKQKTDLLLLKFGDTLKGFIGIKCRDAETRAQDQLEILQKKYPVLKN